MNKIIIISGFSGVGKGSVIKKLLEKNTDIGLSVSDTDREKRNDTDRYTFLTPEEFQSNLKNGEYIEYKQETFCKVLAKKKTTEVVMYE